MEGDLICNFKKCRKHLTTYAWVTSCSHIFCDEHGTKEFNKSFDCPACETTLSRKFDIIRVDLQPTEEYKSMVLAGQKPEVIMEICARSLAFWTYQSHQERAYQEYMATKAKNQAAQLEQYYEQIMLRTQTELSSLKSNLATVKKELEEAKKMHNSVGEKLMERSRQYQKLQSLYDALRRKCITPSSFDSGRGDASNLEQTNLRLQNFTLGLSSVDDVLRRHSRIPQGSSPPERDFVLEPGRTPTVDHHDEIDSRFHYIGTPRG
ncbi:E3 ubiquitin-protein ligase CCNB1IP1-like [Gigantopelta aegis]|uniref:E3 ubiquitin-protein ligase CCNB1IP1-like n=1 Tax=Gigantopelta aegis TaxID=1735272 RepID=UPI001B88A9EF|nr:E3 ubiquitin-protein ligase CCNB1IP1-like [Gigantopelta aegis]